MSIFSRQGRAPGRPSAALSEAACRRLALLHAADLPSGASFEEVQRALARMGMGEVFADEAALARTAQQTWWLRLLGRLDGDLADDLVALPAADRDQTVRATWSEQLAGSGRCWELSLRCPDDAELRAGLRRYCRLLGLYAGVAGPGDDADLAVAAGAHLAAELSGVALDAHLPEAAFDAQAIHPAGPRRVGH